MQATDSIDVVAANRKRYQAVVVHTKPNTRAERILGAGKRACFYVAGEGKRDVVLLTIVGQRVRLNVQDISLSQCLDREGRPIPFSIEDGQLVVGGVRRGNWGGVGKPMPDLP